MAMRLADTFLVHRRSSFAVLFSGQTPYWSLPRSFWTTQAASTVRCGLIRHRVFDSYEVLFKVRRRTRGADGRRHLRRACKLKCPWFGVRTFNNTGNWSPALSNTYAGRIVSCIDSIPHRPADSGHFENSNTGPCLIGISLFPKIMYNSIINWN